MDFESLKNPNFDVNAWISQTLLNLPEDANLEEIVDNLSIQLQQEINATTLKIDSLSQQIVVQVPRVARDFESTHKEINYLQQEINAGFNEADNVQKKTTASMTTLERLDNIKTNLSSASAALQEADKWTSLGKQIEQLLDSGDVHKSYECILGMEKSLSVLDQSTSEPEERRLILEEVKNRLEALATKHIIQAFDTNNSENAKKFFIMFSNLERTSQYVKYFENSEKIKLSQEWRNHVELLSFKEATVKFYDNLMDHLRQKVQWCKFIFSESDDTRALNVLLGLYTETLNTLEPSPQFCFEIEAKKQPFLELLIHFNQTTHRFVQNLRQTIESGCDGKPNQGKILALLKVLFYPFVPQYEKFAKHHQSQIVNKIQAAVASMTGTGHTQSGEITTLLQERIDCAKRLLPEIILSVKEGEEKISMLNMGYGYYHFGKGVNGGLERFGDWYQEVFKILEKSINHPERQRSLLENSLTYAETCGEILLQLTKLDQAMTANCQKILLKLNVPQQNEWEAYSEIYMDSVLLLEISQFFQRKETLLGKTISRMKKLCQDATQLILRVTAEPIETQLKKNFMLVDSSLKEAIPSEYITQMGEYLMLLPQNLDPFITSETSSLSYAFDQGGEEESRSPVVYILSNLCSNLCAEYAERILKITYLSDGQARQLSQDIDYLSSVLEDLEKRLTPDLLDISRLMKIYSTINESTSVEKVSTKILGAIKKMKNKPVNQ